MTGGILKNRDRYYADIAEAVMELSANTDNLAACRQISGALIRLMPEDSAISPISLNELIIFKQDVIDSKDDLDYVNQQVGILEQELNSQIKSFREKS